MPQLISTSDEETLARSAMYRLLARLLLREVDHELLQALSATPVRSAYVEAGGVLPTGSEENALEDLSIDYCQLFLGPSQHLPPYQSVWSSGEFHGTPVNSMQRFIDVAGYSTDVLPRGIMLDHLGVQLDLMGHVLWELASCGVDSADGQSIYEMADAYFTTHLCWPGELLNAAAQRANTEFYRAAALMTRRFLQSESVVATEPLPIIS